MSQINEGGNIFKNPTGEPATQRINQADVDPTIAWLEKIKARKLILLHPGIVDIFLLNFLILLFIKTEKFFLINS